MPRARAVVLAAVLTVGPLLSGCSADEGLRAAGSAATAQEAGVLAGLLHRNHRYGGADFVATAPYGSDTVLTLTGEIDFRTGAGRAEAVTTFATGRADDVRTVFFTREHVWMGGLPGLAEAVAGRSGGTDVGHLRRPVTTAADDGGPVLLDVVLGMLLHLAQRTADDPRSFASGYTWEGQRSIDGRLTSLFALRGGGTLAMAADDGVLVQYAAPLADGAVDVTITLSGHGRRSIRLPADEQSAPASAHPELAAALGI